MRYPFVVGFTTIHTALFTRSESRPYVVASLSGRFSMCEQARMRSQDFGDSDAAPTTGAGPAAGSISQPVTAVKQPGEFSDGVPGLGNRARRRLVEHTVIRLERRDASERER
jgi:hypothetical protein